MKKTDLYTIQKEKALKHKMLSHYTNIEALKNIIENKSIQLTNVRNLNDKYENEFLDDHLKEKIYVASFTHRKWESYFYWKTYAVKNNQTDKGVIIQFDTNDISSLCDKKITKYYKDDQNKNIILKKDNKNYGGWTDWNTSLLDVKYSSVKMINRKYKDLYSYVKTFEWNGEQETRLRIAVSKNGCEIFNNFDTKSIEYYKPKYQHIYIDLSYEIFKKIKIILSPWGGKEERQEVMKICEDNHIPSTCINNSCLKGKV